MPATHENESKRRYALVLLDYAMLFEYVDDIWQIYPINDELSNPLTDEHSAANILKELDDHINTKNQLHDIELIVIYENKSCLQLIELTKTLLELQSTNWQLLSWQTMLQKFNDTDIITYDINWFSQTFLPVINDNIYNKKVDNFIEKKLINTDTTNELDTALQTNQQLKEKVQRLQSQASALQSLSINKILTFMPAIYQNFWHVVKPTDIGLLAGEYEIPIIPSPFPEPTSDTIHILKKQFLALSESDKQKIIEFCDQLTYPLTMRSEFKPLIV